MPEVMPARMSVSYLRSSVDSSDGKFKCKPSVSINMETSGNQWAQFRCKQRIVPVADDED
jgi:hypothetical protein